MQASEQGVVEELSLRMLECWDARYGASALSNGSRLHGAVRGADPSLLGPLGALLVTPSSPSAAVSITPLG